jgi:hypothetical protein
LNPVSEQECLSLQEKVLELAFLLHRDLKKIMGEGQFPKYREIDDNLQKLEVETS